MSIQYWGFLKTIRENPAYLNQIFPGFVSDDVESVLGAEKLEIPTSKSLSDKWHGETRPGVYANLIEGPNGNPGIANDAFPPEMNSEDNGKSCEGAVYTMGELRAFVLMLARKVPSQSPQNRMRRRLRLHQAPVRGNWFPYEVLGDYVRTKENHKRLAIFEPRAQVQFVIGVAEFADDPYLRPFYKLVFE